MGMLANGIPTLTGDLWRLFYHRSQADKDSKVHRAGRDLHIVSVGKQKGEVFTEMAFGEIDFYVESGFIEGRLPPHENDLVSEEDRKRVVEVLCEYLKNNRWTYILDG